MNTKYALIAFDFDGTLADSVPWFEGMINQVARKYRFGEMALEDLSALRAHDSRELVQRLGIPAWKLPFIARHVRGLMKRSAPELRLFAGVEHALQQLHGAGATLAIVSSNSVDNVQRVLGRENAGLIHHYACGISLYGKARRLRQLMQRHKVNAREAILVGDEIRDLAAARAVNINAGAVAWGYNTLAALEQQRPDEVFHTTADLCRLLITRDDGEVQVLR